MPAIRTGRRRYYDLFSSFYDLFIRLHARRNEDDTRTFLVDAAQLASASRPRILDICCGTGSVILTFADRHPEALLVGYDFSHGMLLKTREKDGPGRVAVVEGDAASLPFADHSFDVVTCSHALYELKGMARRRALEEMRRVVADRGVVLLMEHEVPKRPLIKLMFYLRVYSMGAGDAREFIRGETTLLEKIFSQVSVTHSPSGKSKLMACRG
ncbi:MAG: methyltransferase domain-containing protein [Deltaproteobacteria bacterium]|nr:methyltransferase domain-containing protein [Candidatus Anaeroferrophillus wilburensis]MBN2888497.1 methyltransferase domain-containing protein [Deltaproteobacteria bacterium]